MDAKLYLITIDKNPAEAAEIAANVARKIENKETKLLEVVQSLGEPLTDEDRTIRAKAIAYLGAVLNGITGKSVTRQHVSVLAEFLCARLEDEVALKETSLALTALVKTGKVPKEDILKVAETLFKTVDMKKHPQGTRFVVLTLLDRLMADYRPVLKEMGDDFVTGFVSLVALEKDPRNLMIVFSLMRVILVEFDIERHVEALFDGVYCYFPITFRPPPDDPYQITTQQLKDRLRDCLTSTPLFAPHLFPPLIEKLDSTNENVKKDSLQTMVTAAKNFGPLVMRKYYGKIWDSVKYEVLNALPNESDEVMDEALRVVKELGSTLSYGLNGTVPEGSPLAIYVKTVSKECLDSLKEPQTKKAKSAAILLSTVASSSSSAYYGIVVNSVPALMTIYEGAEELVKQKSWMEVILHMLDAGLSVYGTWGDLNPAPVQENPLAKFSERLFEIYSQALMGGSKDDTSKRLIALKGLDKMARMRSFLSEADIGVVVVYLNEVILEENKEDVRKQALDNLLDFSKYRSNLLIEKTFPSLMAALPDEEPKELVVVPYPIILEALAKLSLDRAIFDVLITRLLNKLIVIVRNNAGEQYVQAILATILVVLEKKVAREDVDVPNYYGRLATSILTRTFIVLLSSEAASCFRVMHSNSVLSVTARILNILIRSLSSEEQSLALKELWKLFVSGEPSQVRSAVAGGFRPFQGESASELDSSIIIFAAIFAGLRREVEIPQHKHALPDFFKANVELARSSATSEVRQAHLVITSVLVNKYASISGQVSEVVDGLITGLKSPNQSLETAENNIRLLFWIGKGLVTKGDKSVVKLLPRLVELLNSQQFGSVARRGFAVLFGDNEFINQSNHAVLSRLAKQKAFALSVPEIVEGFKSAQADLKSNYLVALSAILRSVPSEVILPELPELFPLLLQSLDLDEDADVKKATIGTLYVTITESPGAAKEHMKSLITRLLKAASEVSTNPPRVRASALRCLKTFPSVIGNDDVRPYKSLVVRSLVPVLDDPKRAVRKEAVTCRAKWIAIDEPED
ncbi:ARM repeat-containing protein [Ascobolus immersus RN42]|uniref:MMS19 nucleotide excision repair protein n=1 Tax=Ascobolus immersus RN42 TaxID=1160509 RepID=A0A3N4IPQ4_ASCIM|nr:ARM repeat-containing protein [Ascobolus immersus RN42]